MQGSRAQIIRTNENCASVLRFVFTLLSQKNDIHRVASMRRRFVSYNPKHHKHMFVRKKKRQSRTRYCKLFPRPNHSRISRELFENPPNHSTQSVQRSKLVRLLIIWMWLVFWTRTRSTTASQERLWTTEPAPSAMNGGRVQRRPTGGLWSDMGKKMHVGRVVQLSRVHTVAVYVMTYDVFELV